MKIQGFHFWFILFLANILFAHGADQFKWVFIAGTVASAIMMFRSAQQT